MNELELIKSDLKSGESISYVARKYHHNNDYISSIRKSLNLPSLWLLDKLKEFPDFEQYFTDLYINNSLQDIKIILRKHPIFSRCRDTSLPKRIDELRKYYNIPCKFPENSYLTESDRIKGYIIRNSKFMAKRRGIYFNLTYHDFEIPKYCPILGIKLKYLSESDGNSFDHATLDRIDNSKGYIKGNVIVISRLANAMKNAANFNQLQSFCDKIPKLINHYETHGVLGSISDVFGSFETKEHLTSSR